MPPESGHSRPDLPLQPKSWLNLGSSILSGSTGYNWILTLVDQAVVSGTGFLAGVIIGRSCAKEQFGLYALGLSILTIIIVLHEVLVWSPYTVLSPRLTGKDLASYTGSTLIHQLTLSFLAMLLLSGVGLSLSQGLGPHALGPVIWVLVFVGPLYVLREYARRLSFARLRIRAAIFLNAFTSMVQVGGLFWLAYLGKLSASWAFAVMGFGCGLGGLLWLLAARRDLTLSFTQAVSDLCQNWSFSKWVLGAYVFGLLSVQLYPWILNLFHGAAEVGLLAACQGGVALVHPFLQGSCIYLEPKAAHCFAEGGLKNLRNFVWSSTAVIALVLGVFCAALFAFGEKWVIFIYGTQYTGSGLIVAVLALNALVQALDHGFYYGILAARRPDLVFQANLVRLAVTVTLGVWLVKASAALGVSYGLLAASLAATSLHLLIFMKYFYQAPLAE